jgi:predicted amidophosphoribosyltransferase
MTTARAPLCESCDRRHPKDARHCPNCGQAGGFHATWNLAQCPTWVPGKGWVQPAREEMNP